MASLLAPGWYMKSVSKWSHRTVYRARQLLRAKPLSPGRAACNTGHMHSLCQQVDLTHNVFPAATGAVGSQIMTGVVFFCCRSYTWPVGSPPLQKSGNGQPYTEQGQLAGKRNYPTRSRSSHTTLAAAKPECSSAQQQQWMILASHLHVRLTPPALLLCHEAVRDLLLLYRCG
jgi:hypothetical protein